MIAAASSARCRRSRPALRAGRARHSHVAHHPAQRPRRVLGIEVDRDVVRRPSRRDRALDMKTARTGISPRQLGDGVAHRVGDVLGAGEQRPDEDRDQRVDPLPGGQGPDRLAVLLGPRRGDHVDRVDQRGLGRQEARPARSRTSAGISGTSSPAASQASAHMIAGPPALVRIPTAVAGRQRLAGEQRGDVEQLGEGLGADHSGLLEEGVDGDVGGGEHRAGVGAGRPPARHRAAALDDDDRLARGRSAGPAARSDAGR